MGNPSRQIRDLDVTGAQLVLSSRRKVWHRPRDDWSQYQSSSGQCSPEQQPGPKDRSRIRSDRGGSGGAAFPVFLRRVAFFFFSVIVWCQAARSFSVTRRYTSLYCQFAEIRQTVDSRSTFEINFRRPVGAGAGIPAAVFWQTLPGAGSLADIWLEMAIPDIGFRERRIPWDCFTWCVAKLSSAGCNLSSVGFRRLESTVSRLTPCHHVYRTG